jgi:hypothetical protein
MDESSLERHTSHTIFQRPGEMHVLLVINDKNFIQRPIPIHSIQVVSANDYEKYHTYIASKQLLFATSILTFSLVRRTRSMGLQRSSTTFPFQIAHDASWLYLASDVSTAILLLP